MIDERLVELIHAELDGELDEAGSRELEAGLAASEAARAYRDSMRELDAFLVRVPPAEPPSALHGQIMEQLKLPSARGRLGFAWRVPVFVRYGLAVAAGLLLSLGLFRIVPGPGTSTGVENMTGTLMPAAPARQVLDGFEFEQPGLKGSASLVRQADGLVLEAVWFSEQPTRMTVDAGSSGWHIDGIDQSAARLDRVEVEAGSVQVTAQGHQQFAVRLGAAKQELNEARGAIRLSWDSDGVFRQSGELQPE